MLKAKTIKHEQSGSNYYIDVTLEDGGSLTIVADSKEQAESMLAQMNIQPVTQDAFHATLELLFLDTSGGDDGYVCDEVVNTLDEWMNNGNLIDWKFGGAYNEHIVPVEVPYPYHEGDWGCH